VEARDPAFRAGLIDGAEWLPVSARRSVLQQHFVAFKSIIEFAGSLARHTTEMTAVADAVIRRSVTNADCHLADYCSSSSSSSMATAIAMTSQYRHRIGTRGLLRGCIAMH